MAEIYYEDHPTDPDKVIIRKQVRTTTPEDIQKIQREWVGLTDEDRRLVRKWTTYNQYMTAAEYAEAVQIATEAKLKEKNT